MSDDEYMSDVDVYSDDDNVMMDEDDQGQALSSLFSLRVCMPLVLINLLFIQVLVIRMPM